jgi:hypothetical protein
MATTKSARLDHLDYALKNLQDIADKVGYHIDSDPDYIELTKQATDWQFGYIRMNKDTRLKMELLHRAVTNRVYAVGTC